MTTSIIITLCVLLLIAYVFDLTASRTKIPSVIMLLFVGWIVRQITSFFSIAIPDLSEILPVLGTVGLVLIVLEGALELDFSAAKYPLMKKAFLLSLLPMIVVALVLSLVFAFWGNNSFRICLINIIPLCVISSAIAIPSVKILPKELKEFVIYESSFSDILGILFFNFILSNHEFGFLTFGGFIVQIIFTIIFSIIITVGLSILIHKNNHHIKYVPILFLIILIYAISKIFHLPGLILILVFGIILGNIDEFKKKSWLRFIKSEDIKGEIIRFRNIVSETAFVIRALFFLLFGYLIKSSELFNIDTILISVIIVASIFIARFAMLKFLKFDIAPLLFIAPRGLITILLILSIEPQEKLSIVNNSLLIQVIILSALIMMFGLMLFKNSDSKMNHVVNSEK